MIFGSLFDLDQDKDYASLPEVTKAFGSKELHPSAFKPAAQDETCALGPCWHHDISWPWLYMTVMTLTPMTMIKMIKHNEKSWQIWLKYDSRQLCFHRPIGERRLPSWVHFLHRDSRMCLMCLMCLICLMCLMCLRPSSTVRSAWRVHLRLWSSYLKRQTLRCQTETTIFGVNLSERFKRIKYRLCVFRTPTSQLLWICRHIFDMYCSSWCAGCLPARLLRKCCTTLDNFIKAQNKKAKKWEKLKRRNAKILALWPLFAVTDGVVFFLALVEDRECKAKLYSVTERAFAELRVSKSLFWYWQQHV